MTAKDQNTKDQTPKTDSDANSLWGGRFAAGPAAIMEAINASIDFDRLMYTQDLAGSRAHCNMLMAQGIIGNDDGHAILTGLDQIEGEIRDGKLEYSADLEDIHMHIEARLHEIIGPAAGCIQPGHVTTRWPQISGFGYGTPSTIRTPP